MKAAVRLAVSVSMSLSTLSASVALAMPDLRQPSQAGPLTVYPDDTRRLLFYYAPGALAVATREGGEPDIHLLHARYTGSAATGDRGVAVLRSIFTLRVVMDGPTTAQLAEARLALARSVRPRPGDSIELRPLPIRRLESAIVYTPIDRPPPAAGPSASATASSAPASSSAPGTAPAATASAADSAAARETDPATHVLPAGHFENADAAASAPREGYWTSRIYTLGLGAADAQLLSDALARGRTAISIGYAFLADGIGPDAPLEELSGTPALVEALKKRIAPLAADGRSGAADSRAGDAPTPRVVRAGAIAITADLARWPRLVQRVDINESAPPGYAALDVYCYDFNQGESPLYEKQVEIDAAGVGGQRVQMTARFSRAQPDLYARSLRFPVAVRLDRPYRYRVIDIAPDGTSRQTAWQERTSWTELLDVTTGAAAAIAAATSATASVVSGGDR